MRSMQGAQAYSRIEVESQAISASPHQLITLLFDGALKQIMAAKAFMSAGHMDSRAQALNKSLDIINEGLLAGLDLETGGEVAQNLAQLYEYITRLLLQANRDSDEQKLVEAYDLLENIAHAWREVGHARG
jgi:flagellar protein FliS